MDALSTLEAELIGAEEASSAKYTLPAADFTASLDYIDSLASRRAIALSQRDALAITSTRSRFDYNSAVVVPKGTVGLDDLSFKLSTDFRPLGDARRYSPEFSERRPASLVRSSSRVVVYPRAVSPLDPDRDPGDYEDALRRIDRIFTRPSPFARRAFSKPNQVVICLKRKIRRAVMGAGGYLGGSGFRAPSRTYYSRIIC